VLKRDTTRWTTTTADRAELDNKLAAAHSKLEKKFLEGGAVLVAIMDILKRLIGSLDNLTGALDGKTTTETIERIQATARELASLPQFELNRLQGFERLAVTCKAMRDSVDDMRDTMRYLRTFAVTVKITGAGLAEFADFADEIRARIQSGSDEVNKFATELSAMHQQLASAQVFSGNISRNYGDIVPKIVYELEHNAGKVAEHHRNLAAIANEVKALARGIQGKIATVLSALQIGDITRQRIEHIRASFVHFEEFRASAEASALEEDAIARVDGAISQLAAAQMQETVADFQRDCRKVLETMSRFVDDTRDILALREQMQQQSDGGNANFLSGLEVNVAAASKLVGNVHETSRQADGVAQSTGSTAQSLLAGIEVIRSIKTDIHYMALNSNLRCSKLGDEGRSVNVVSAELRFFAEKLEEPANKVLGELQHFESAAGALSKGNETGGHDISQPLNEALVAIRQVSSRMEGSIHEFEREGQEVFTKVSAAIGTLDFESELGEVLDDCVRTANELAELAEGDISDVAHQVAGLSSRIYKIYTMAPERDVHLAYFPMDAAEEPVAAPAAAASDEELFEDALF
jgi:hypothetical protein